jgi:hypothetical protein
MPHPVDPLDIDSARSALPLHAPFDPKRSGFRWRKLLGFAIVTMGMCILGLPFVNALAAALGK